MERAEGFNPPATANKSKTFHCFQAFRRLLLLPISPLSITSVSESQVSVFFSHLHASGLASFFVWFEEGFNFPKAFCFLFIEFHGSLLTWVVTSEDLGV